MNHFQFPTVAEQLVAGFTRVEQKYEKDLNDLNQMNNRLQRKKLSTAILLLLEFL